jgi:hypothetical protein
LGRRIVSFDLGELEFRNFGPGDLPALDRGVGRALRSLWSARLSPPLLAQDTQDARPVHEGKVPRRPANFILAEKRQDGLVEVANAETEQDRNVPLPRPPRVGRFAPLLVNRWPSLGLLLLPAPGIQRVYRFRAPVSASSGGAGREGPKSGPAGGLRDRLTAP